MLTRRDFLSSAAGVPLAAAGLARTPSRSASAAAPLGQGASPSEQRREWNGSPIAIDAARLRRHIEDLSVFGRPPGGTFADGVTRVAYSRADLDARNYVLNLMREAMLVTRIDPAGNIHGYRAGHDTTNLPPILFGSHIDSVPNGGNFDGVLGTLAAIEAVQALNDAGLHTNRRLEIVVWQNEEGVAFGNGLCGSRAAAGEFPDSELDQVWNGTRMADAMAFIGGDPAKIAQARRAPGTIHCYLELHIEQGGTLDAAGVSVGIVEGIVGIDRYAATVTGMANHAGTTTMADRRDALVAASQLVLAVNEVVKAEPGRQVGTVGQLAVVPNAPNVVPGQVTLTVELRDLSVEKIDRLYGAIERRAQAIAAATGTAITLRPTSHHEPALAHPGLVEVISRSATDLHLPAMKLPSGAGHDGQMLAKLCPMGMIFVRSAGGISHSPRETTSWEDCARGASLLLLAVMNADRADLGQARSPRVPGE